MDSMNNVIQNVSSIIGNLYNFSTVFIPGFFVYSLLEKNKNKYKFIKFFLFALYIFSVLYVMGIGTIYDIGMYDELIRFDETIFKVFSSQGALTYILNIIMFVPFGFLVPFLWKSGTLKRTTISAFLFSLLIECAQLFNIRNTAIDDLIMNVCGAIIGFFIYKIFEYFYKLISHKIKVQFLHRLLQPKEEMRKGEIYIYILVMVMGKFLFYNWRGYLKIVMTLFPTIYQ